MHWGSSQNSTSGHTCLPAKLLKLSCAAEVLNAIPNSRKNSLSFDFFAPIGSYRHLAIRNAMVSCPKRPHYSSYLILLFIASSTRGPEGEDGTVSHLRLRSFEFTLPEDKKTNVFHNHMEKSGMFFINQGEVGRMDPRHYELMHKCRSGRDDLV
jgi:hypothetical protein